jgi:hypothetical protein
MFKFGKYSNLVKNIFPNKKFNLKKMFKSKKCSISKNVQVQKICKNLNLFNFETFHKKKWFSKILSDLDI